jgi:hypothetical protein
MWHVFETCQFWRNCRALAYRFIQKLQKLGSTANLLKYLEKKLRDFGSARQRRR